MIPNSLITLIKCSSRLKADSGTILSINLRNEKNKCVKFVHQYNNNNNLMYFSLMHRVTAFNK